MLDINRYTEVIPGVFLPQNTKDSVQEVRKLFPIEYFKNLWFKYPDKFGVVKSVFISIVDSSTFE